MATINLKDFGVGGQYEAVTGRKRKMPYISILTAAAPALRTAARNKTLDEQRSEELQQTQRNFDASQVLAREQMEIQESQAKKSAAIGAAQTGLATAYMADKAGIIDLKDVASGAGKKLWPGAGSTVTTAAAAPELTAAGTEGALTSVGSGAASYEAGGALAPELVGEAGATTGGGVGGTTTSSGGMGGYAPVLAIIAAADIIRKQYGGLDKEYEDRSAVEKFNSAPVTGGVPALLDLAGVGDNTYLGKATSELAKGEERLVGVPLDKAFEGDILGSLESFAEGVWRAPEAIWKSVTGGGTWLCTEIEKHHRLTWHERRALLKLRRHANDHFIGWLRAYLQEGPKLVAAIAGQEGSDLQGFYGELKKILVDQVTALIDAADMSTAFEVYKSETIRLCGIYAPEIAIQEVAR